MNNLGTALAQLQPASLEEVQAAVLAHSHVRAYTGGTKPALCAEESGVTLLNLSKLSGLMEYNPSEYTFTAWAGTPLSQIESALAEHGQYLPFDPPFVEQGATLGGTVAANLSGPGRYRYGGVRDFIIGVKLVDGTGRLVHGGGKVVKNSAGFDIPKLMVGSLGLFGVMTELSFKVFPKPPASVTLSHTVTPMPQAIACLNRLYASRADIDAIDFEPLPDGLKFWVRLRGLPDALPARAERVQALMGGGEVFTQNSDSLWKSAITHGTESVLIKVTLTSGKLLEVESYFSQMPNVQRRYSGGGNSLWLRTDAIPATLSSFLESHGLSALVLKGPGPVRLGRHPGLGFERRIKQVFDPQNRFPTV